MKTTHLFTFTLILSALAAGAESTSASQFSLSASEIGAEPTETGDEGDGALSFCHSGEWSATCLTALIVYRCEQYTFPFTPYGCALAAAAFVNSLEMKRIDVLVEGESYNLPVIFTARLERMIRTPQTHAWLSELRGKLVESAKNKTHFDLWKWTLATSKKESLALERLAVLLQDTSAIEIQVKYLQEISAARHFDPATLKAITDLDEISYQLNYEILADGDWKSRLHLYPPISKIEEEATPLIYHFYPMAFTARLLQNAGLGDRLSSFIPFLFNTEYLNQTLDPEAWPLHHPKPFKLDEEWIQWKMKDLYGGYVGALWGVQKTRKIPGLAPFEKGYSKAPYATMKHLFWSMPSP